MAFLQINTNVKKEDIMKIKKDILKDATDLVQGIISDPVEELTAEKPAPSYDLAVQINPDQMMSFGGTTAPCATVYLTLVDKISKRKNFTFSKAITTLMGTLGVPDTRMYIFFVDVPKENCGLRGTTLAFPSNE